MLRPAAAVPLLPPARSRLRGDVARATLYATARGVLRARAQRRARRRRGARAGLDRLPRADRVRGARRDRARCATATNVLGAILGDGWYAGIVGFDARRPGNHYGREPELLCELHIEYADGSARGRRHRRALGGDDRPARVLRPADGRALRRAARARAVAIPVAVSARATTSRLVPERAQPIRVTEELAPVAVDASARPGVHVVDFGQNMVGWARLARRGRARHARPAALRRDARARRLAATSTTCAARASSTPTCSRGDGRRGLRAALHLPRLPLRRGDRRRRASSSTGSVVHSDTPRTGWFECSDELVNQLWRNIDWGQRGNFLAVPPTARSATSGSAGSPTPRSSSPPPRSTWTSPPSSPSGATTCSTPSRPTARIPTSRRGWSSSATARRRGATPGSSCRGRSGGATATAGCSSATGPRWSATWPTCCATTRTCCGRRGAATTTATGCRSASTRRARCSPPPTGPTTRSSWPRWPTRSACRDRAEHYERLRAGDRRRLQPRVRRRRRLHRRRHADRLPARAAHGPAARRAARRAPPSVWSTNIARNGWHLTTGFVGVGLLCPVLSECGTRDVAYQLLLNETFPSWGYSIRHGATTIWERWDGWTEDRGFQTPAMNSFNHYSLGSVGQWLYEYVAGIRAAEARLRARPDRARARPARVGPRDLPLRARPDHQRVAPGRRHVLARASRSRRTSPRRSSLPGGETHEIGSGPAQLQRTPRRPRSERELVRARPSAQL